MANTSPLFDPNHAFTGRATGAAVVGCRLLKIAAAKVNGASVPVAHCGASDNPIGVSSSDVVQNDDVAVYPATQVLRVESGGTIAFGAAVEVAANGKVVTYSSGRKVGVAWEAATNGTFPLIQLQL